MKRYDVVAGVVLCNNKVLCLQKGATKYDYTSYKWEFPGGKIENGETAAQALHRELLEELKIDVEVRSHLITVEHKYKDFAITLRAYICLLSEQELSLTEHVASRWVEKDRIMMLDWCAADVPIAQAVLRLLSQKN